MHETSREPIRGSHPPDPMPAPHIESRSRADADLVAAVRDVMPERRDVFVLGAGFSMALGQGRMPSMNDLGDSVTEMAMAVHRARVGTHSSNCDGLSCDSPQLIDRRPPAPFELWMGQLAENQPYLSVAENARARALFLELLDWTELEVRRATQATLQEAPVEWIRPLIHAWHQRQVAVLTFNYDTLVESYLERAEIPLPSHPRENLRYLSIGPSLITRWQPGLGGSRITPEQSFQYFKLHGSIHWHWDEATRSGESIIEIDLPERWDESGADNRRHRSRGLAPMLVPPLSSKSGYLENPIMRELWRLAYVELLVAKRIIFIGYSLPQYDLLVSSMLRSVTRRHADGTDVPVIVVDKDPAVANRLGDLGFTNVDRQFTAASDPVAAFMDSYLPTSLDS